MLSLSLKISDLAAGEAAVIKIELLPRLQTAAFRQTDAVQKSLVENVNSADVLKTRFAFVTCVSLSGDKEDSSIMLCHWINSSRRFGAHIVQIPAG